MVTKISLLLATAMITGRMACSGWTGQTDKQRGISQPFGRGNKGRRGKPRRPTHRR